MTLKHYLESRRGALTGNVGRKTCTSCRKPALTCYCAELRPFASRPRFVILIHRDEARRGIATGRMAHLGLSNSLLFEGTDFSADERVTALVTDPTLYPVVLYPDPAAVNLSRVMPGDRAALFPAGRELVVFVIDGTWATARRMRWLSRNLHGLPTISFTPPRPSGFRVRKQPSAECFSTVEAIHELIELLGPSPSRPHDSLLAAFSRMVAQQVDFEARHGGPKSVRGLRCPLPR